MEALGPLAQMIAKYGLKKMPHEINITKIEENNRYSLLVAVIRNDEEESLATILDAYIFGQVVEGWRAASTQGLSLWLVRGADRNNLACDFVRRYGKIIEAEKNPLTWKGLDFSNERCWPIILNDASAHPQGELFSTNPKGEVIVVDPGNNENYQLLRRARKRGEYSYFDVYKMSKKTGEQFRSIYPHWVQKNIFEKLQEQEAVRIPVIIEEAG